MSDMIAWLQFWTILIGMLPVFFIAEEVNFPKVRATLYFFLIVIAGPWIWNLLFWNAQLAEVVR